MALLTGKRRLRLENSDLGVALATAPTIAVAFRLYVPHWSDVRLAAQEAQDGQKTPEALQERLDAMRAGYVPATAVGALIGAASGILARSWLPVGAAVLTIAGLITLQEASAPAGTRLPPTDALGAGFAALFAEREFAAALEDTAGPKSDLVPVATGGI